MIGAPWAGLIASLIFAGMLTPVFIFMRSKWFTQRFCCLHSSRVIHWSIEDGIRTEKCECCGKITFQGNPEEFQRYLRR